MRERVRVRVKAPRTIYDSHNLLQHIIRSSQNLNIPKPKNPIAPCPQIISSLPIRFFLLNRLSAIKLNSELFLEESVGLSESKAKTRLSEARL
jgi:hypothetical protein